MIVRAQIFLKILKLRNPNFLIKRERSIISKSLKTCTRIKMRKILNLSKKKDSTNEILKI